MSDVLSGDMIDVRDVIKRFEELESELDGVEESEDNADEFEEFKALKSVLDDLEGYGGDEQWRGNWYPLQLIEDSYFEKYAEQFAEDIGAVDRNASWPNDCIDWEKAARELQVDYSTVEIDGVTYWYR